MDVFNLRDAVVDEYREYVESFVRVLDPPPAGPRAAHGAEAGEGIVRRAAEERVGYD